MILVTDRIAIDENEIQESFVRASGPGGQNVNKVASAVQLRFDARHSPNLPPYLVERLPAIAGHLLTKDGVLIINAQRFRTQDRNRADGLERLLDVLRRAADRPLPRRPTRPTLASKVRRLTAKTRRSTVKQLRGTAPSDE